MNNTHINSIQTEAAMNNLLVSINKQADPNYIAIKNILISYMYTTCVSEDKIYEIFVDFCNTKTLPCLNMVPGFCN